MSWREDLKRELIGLLVEHAGVDYENSDYVEDEWHEFMGTLYEGDTRMYGVRLHLVLLDGTLYEWRWAGHPGELILHLTRGS